MGDRGKTITQNSNFSHDRCVLTPGSLSLLKLRISLIFLCHFFLDWEICVSYDRRRTLCDLLTDWLTTHMTVAIYLSPVVLKPKNSGNEKLKILTISTQFCFTVRREGECLEILRWLCLWRVSQFPDKVLL